MKYFTKTPGIGGRIRRRIEDFIVEEIPKPIIPGDEYTIFWLEKFNWDVHRALKAIAKKLHIGIKRFGIAGTKDKRALTRQRVSVWRIEPEELEKIDIKNIKLYGFEKSAERINLGDLEGNKFTITIRDIDLSKEELEKRLNLIFSELKNGIPNYFGPQRFGEVRKITHLIGREMLKNDFENALKIYLYKVFENESEDSKTARNFLNENWNKEGFKKALELFPKRLKYERSMIDYLYKYPTDYAGALRRLPKKLRKMFLNAIQADIWNKAVEEYLKNNKLEQQKVPLVGFDTQLNEENKIHKIILKILEENNIKLEEFLMKSMPELKCSGSERYLILMPNDLNIIEIADDELNEGKRKAKISFVLPPGSYATVVLNEILKA